MAISVVISVHNGGRQFQNCLAGLARHREQFNELLVVDDGSADYAPDDAQNLGARILRVGSRRGPANGRNVGALAATGDILVFLDADVIVHDDTLRRIRQCFEEDPGLGAIFGSYDSEPEDPHFVSQFRNLLHFYVHQTSNRFASTFWSGCGAIRREIFLENRGFDPSYSMPSVEDIELGSRLVRKGVRVALDPSIQVKHLKRWTLWTMVVNDIRWRGICWTRLILASHQMPNDLNLRYSSRISVALMALFCALTVTLVCGAFAGQDAPLLGGEAALLPVVFGSILALNLPFYRSLAGLRGYGFAAAAVPLHLIHFSCCATALILGIALHLYGWLAKQLRPITLRHDDVRAKFRISVGGAMPAIGISMPNTFSPIDLPSPARFAGPVKSMPNPGDLAGTIESALLTHLPHCQPDSAGSLSDALYDALFPGGKRLRPLLTLLAARIFGEQGERVLRVACAVEFVHTSSLIIDDLPCMDDADLRRGNPSLHRLYGEEVALLAGIALLNQAYALFGDTPELIREAAQCIGPGGMIGGQAIDLRANPGEASLADRDRKTSALIRLSLTAGALAAGASRDQVAALAVAGQRLGQAYQICDDMEDAALPVQATGKTAGQDSRHNRPSHAVRLDEDEPFVNACRLVDEARRSLVETFGPSTEITRLTDFIDKTFAPLARGLRQPV